MIIKYKCIVSEFDTRLVTNLFNFILISIKTSVEFWPVSMHGVYTCDKNHIIVGSDYK